MNKQFLKEDVKHGTDSYAFAQYHMFNLMYWFYMPYHWHDEVEIIYVKSGKVNILIDNKEYEGKRGDIFWVNPEQIHLMYTEDLEADYYTLIFSMDLLAFKEDDEIGVKYFEPLKDGKIKVANYLTEHRSYKRILDSVMKVINNNEEKKELYKLDTRIELLRILELLFVNTPEEYIKRDYTGKNQEILREIISYIDEHYTGKISLKDISKEVHMSEKYFSRFFKENFQINFVDYVNRVRLEKAAKLLLNTDLSVTEVALQCGYVNISYFIRSFKKAFCASPHVFRKN